MLLNVKTTFALLSTLWVLLTLSAPLDAKLKNETLIVSYATAHMNNISDSVQGVLITPKGEILMTSPLDPYEKDKIVIVEPEEGDYIAYFQALIYFKPRVCYIVGGIDANLCSQPNRAIPFTPSKSQIQGFDQSKAVNIGDKTLPIASFTIY